MFKCLGRLLSKLKLKIGFCCGSKCNLEIGNNENEINNISDSNGEKIEEDRKVE